MVLEPIKKVELIQDKFQDIITLVEINIRADIKEKIEENIIIDIQKKKNRKIKENQANHNQKILA